MARLTRKKKCRIAKAFLESSHWKPIGEGDDYDQLRETLLKELEKMVPERIAGLEKYLREISIGFEISRSDLVDFFVHLIKDVYPSFLEHLQNHLS